LNFLQKWNWEVLLITSDVFFFLERSFALFLCVKVRLSFVIQCRLKVLIHHSSRINDEIGTYVPASIHTKLTIRNLWNRRQNSFRCYKCSKHIRYPVFFSSDRKKNIAGREKTLMTFSFLCDTLDFFLFTIECCWKKPTWG